MVLMTSRHRQRRHWAVGFRWVRAYGPRERQDGVLQGGLGDTEAGVAFSPCRARRHRSSNHRDWKKILEGARPPSNRTRAAYGQRYRLGRPKRRLVHLLRGRLGKSLSGATNNDD